MPTLDVSKEKVAHYRCIIYKKVACSGYTTWESCILSVYAVRKLLKSGFMIWENYLM